MKARTYRTDENGYLTMCTPAQDAAIKRDYLQIPIKRLACTLNMSQTRLRKRLKQLDLDIPPELALQRKLQNQIKPGAISWNKGKKLPAHIYDVIKRTMFKSRT